MTVPSAIVSEGRSIIRLVSKARRVEEDMAKVGKPHKNGAQWIGDIAAELQGVGVISPSMRPVDAFQRGLGFWAMRVVAELTFEQWEEMTETLAAEFSSDTQIDVIRFMEVLFDGREMKDGQTVWA